MISTIKNSKNRTFIREKYMTEEIIESEDIKAEEKSAASKAAAFSLLNILNCRKKSGGKKNKAPHALGDFELVLVTLTGIVTFGGVIFSLVMITLMNSIGY